MSLFTVTFDSTDSDADVISPLQMGNISPPQSKPKQKRIVRRKVRTQEKKDEEATVKTEKIDIDHYEAKIKEEEKEKEKIRQRKRKHEVKKNEQQADAEEESEYSDEKEKKEVKRRRRMRVKNTDFSAAAHEKANDEHRIRRRNRSKDDQNSSEGENEEEVNENDKQKRKSKEIKNDEITGEITPAAPAPPKEEPISKNEQEDEDEESQDEKIVNLFKQERLMTQKNGLITYKFSYSSKISWKGRRIHFQLLRGDEALYHAKAKGRTGIEEIPVNSGSDCHFSEKHDAIILAGNENLSFSLRQNNKYGPELCSIRFTLPDTKTKPRMCTLHQFGENLNVPSDLYTRPFIYKGGSYIIRVSSGVAKPSIKNCVLVDKNDKEWIVILKYDKELLTIQASPNYDPIIVFALGVASYMCI